ncbi:hypothetical protein NEF87_001232 [Candidatus Lokiarchaeum ossiferum]|uniref:Uncharacterized protein n=1 Tax=Candidatus Lokiarchaeum ossiferum TaxID=2951803 RepID=A0ABY6HRC8_9ARCH|nr:hypothetical protein NEF87_001232 [Candidatus Lokiarchaeum sp. B-35]
MFSFSFDKVMIRMADNNEEKIEFARKLLKVGMSYRDIQLNLKLKFGSALSNTTIKKIVIVNEENENWKAKFEKSQEELAVYKNLYFEMLKVLKSKLNKDDS